MKNSLLFVTFIISLQIAKAQDCNKYAGDTLQYEACIIAEEAKEHYQFTREYQEIYDRVIEKCPYYANAYYAKSIAYLKSGDFVTWKILIDKAVELEPKEYLGYRAWCRYQFFRDYEGAIMDIERLDTLLDHDMGHSTNGNYHLNIAKGACYKAIGNKAKAIEVIEQQIATKRYFVGIYDYLHLGVLYLESQQYPKAIEVFALQEKENDIAENRYYVAMAYKELGQMEAYFKNMELAKKLYQKGLTMFDSYDIPQDKIYLKQIEEALNTTVNK